MFEEHELIGLIERLAPEVAPYDGESGCCTLCLSEWDCWRGDSAHQPDCPWVAAQHLLGRRNV